MHSLTIEVTRPDESNEIDTYTLYFNIYKHELVDFPERESLMNIFDDLIGFVKTDDEGNSSFEESHYQDVVYRLEKILEIVIHMSYGEIQEVNVDGAQTNKHFVKSEEITKAFETTDTYHILIDTLLADPLAAINFINAVLGI